MIRGEVKELREMEKEVENKLKGLLYEVFRCDLGDLDFGIYRIMNFKKDEIEKFIEKELLEEVEKEFKGLYEEDKKDLEREIENLKKRIIETFGEDALDEEGKLNPIFENTKLGKEYKEKMDAIRSVEEVLHDKIEIFSRIHDFFQRYYADGDLIPIRRYTKDNDYIIPYNGEEVTLYWANKDQYYVKTTEYFHKYTFRSGDYEINFKLREAHIDKNNIKGKDKFFILSGEDFIEIEDKAVNIYFEYRELTVGEYEKFELGERPNKTTIRDRLIKDAVGRINEASKKHPDLIKQLNKPFKKKYKDENDEKKPKKSVLENHLNAYVAKNTKDYFIHKNLRRFFLTELDFYIKNEMLPMEDIEGMNEATLRKVMRRVRVFKNISTKIIEFLAEIEEFEKKLWEKKKFVLRTDYVITLDRIKEYAGEEFLESIVDEILSNEKQMEEWKELFDLDIKKKEELIEKNTLNGKEWKKLPIDMRYFDDNFKWNLLVALTEKNDLDDILNGVLIKSENFQALNLLLEKYYEKVQTTYIDPPFNKEQEADYLYKVNYKDSTWATLLENRLWMARDVLNEKGSIFVRCDYNGNMYVRMLLNEIFGRENFRNEIIITRGMQTRKAENRLLNKTDSLFFYFKTGKGLLSILEREKDHVKCYKETLKLLRKLLDKNTFESVKKKIEESLWMPFLSMPGEQKTNTYREIFGVKLYPPKGRHWAFSQENLNVAVSLSQARLKCLRCNTTITNKSEIKDGKCSKCGSSDFQGEIYSLFNQINNNWTDIPGYEQDPNFPTKNSEILLKRVIESTSNEGDLVMDFFLGSGTTTAVAHKLRRKWIGVEMGEHFWTHVLPRMKKVLFYDKSGISKEKDVKEIYNPKTSGGFFKYQYLEQYEDTLNNIIFAGEEGRQAKLLEFKDYIFHILDYGTRGSMSRLNIDQFKKPFDYKLRIFEKGIEKEMNVDLIETFNYLLGICIKRIYKENANGRDYIWVVGERRDKSLVAVIWRNVENLDLQKDKNHIEENIQKIVGTEPDYIYVNGDSYVENAVPIETEFMKLVGA